MFGLWSDPDDVVAFDDLGELRVFGQKAVAGVDRIGMNDLGGRDDVGDIQIAVGRGRRPDAHCFVGQADVHRIDVRSRMDRNGLDSHLARRAVDAQRDLATVGDQ